MGNAWFINPLPLSVKNRKMKTKISRKGLMDLIIGAHTSAAGGSFHALEHGERIGANGAIQLFTSNQKQWKGRLISTEEILNWKTLKEKLGFSHTMSHASYLINLGSPKKEGLEKSRAAFQEEIERCHALHIPYLNFHPGAALDGGEKACLDTIVESLLSYKDLLKEGSTTLLLETTAGQGSSVGHTFEQLGYIIQKVGKDYPIGVCIDTCHIFAAGYDIRTKASFAKVLEEFDEKIGLSYLKAFHLNDSKKPFGSKRDRHECLGKGEIGIEAFHFLVTHPKTKNLPMYLETPEPELWKEELVLLRQLAQRPL